jgi:hypothetical protein
LILFLTVIQATVGSFIVFLTLADCVGPSNPTYFVDSLLERWCSNRRGKLDVDDNEKDKESNTEEEMKDTSEVMTGKSNQQASVY